MTTHCDEMLLSHGPITGILVSAYRTADGWTCHMRHKHLAGLFTDCELDTYERLTGDELAQVLEASVCGFSAYASGL